MVNGTIMIVTVWIITIHINCLGEGNEFIPRIMIEWKFMKLLN